MKNLNKQQFEAAWAEKPNAVVINVLPSEYFDKEHIPGSINIPIKSHDFVETVEARVPHKDTPVFVYCASQSCDASEKAADQLERAGYKNVYDFTGGMEDWKAEGGKVERGAVAA